MLQKAQQKKKDLIQLLIPRIQSVKVIGIETITAFATYIAKLAIQIQIAKKRSNNCTRGAVRLISQKAR